MASEVGHARNVSNFEILISKVLGFGGVYKPSNADIELGPLQTKFAASIAAMDGVTNKLALEKTGINERQNLFKPLRPTVTRSVNYYASTGAEENAVKDAQSLKRKVDGKRASALPVDDPNTPENEALNVYSSSQQSYIQLVEHFDDLIALYESDVKYAPNEADLATNSLTTYSTSLKTSTTNVINKLTDTGNARLTRKTELYFAGTGLFNLQKLVKKYVKGVFGASSPQYKQISGLKFVNFDE